jgi:hypothetical protein
MSERQIMGEIDKPAIGGGVDAEIAEDEFAFGHDRIAKGDHGGKQALERRVLTIQVKHRN